MFQIGRLGSVGGDKAHAVVPVLGSAILIFNWLITALSFPIIGRAVLYFLVWAFLARRFWQNSIAQDTDKGAAVAKLFA